MQLDAPGEYYLPIMKGGIKMSSHILEVLLKKGKAQANGLVSKFRSGKGVVPWTLTLAMAF